MAITSSLKRLVRTGIAPLQAEARARIVELERALAGARTATKAWKERVTRLEARTEKVVRQLEARTERVVRQLHKTQLALEQTRVSRSEARHEVLTSVAVRASFAHRVHTLVARRRTVSPGEREGVLIEASPAYRASLTTRAETLGPTVHRGTLDGLIWWTPVRNPAKGPKAAWLARQRFPYHGILQTRELAIGGVMLDLGANVGRMAIPRVVLGDVTAVYCAEPDPVTFACLAANVIDNDLRGLVLPDQTAIGDHTGSVLLRRVGESSGFHVVGQSAVGMVTVEVPCTTLDNWVERLQIDLETVTFIKVDVEGFERRVVAGATHVLSRKHIAWQMEIKVAGLWAAGDDPRQLYDDLRQAFTHFIDMNRKATTSRVRPIGELREALLYLEADGKTDVLLFTSGPRG